MKSLPEINAGMKLIVRLAVLIPAELLFNVLGFSWSAEGHRAVADIAEQVPRQSGQYGRCNRSLGSMTLSDIATCPDG